MLEVKIEIDKSTPVLKVEGIKFLKGDDGASAYELAKANGFEGTEEEWLESLKCELTEADKEELAQKVEDNLNIPDDLADLAQKNWVNENFQPKGEYVTTEELEKKLEDVTPEGYATEEYVAQNYQPKGNYLKEIPDEYITDTELTAKGYQTAQQVQAYAQPKGEYATAAQLAETEKKIPTNTSDLLNDSRYITPDDIPVTGVNGKTGNVNLSFSDVGADAAGTAEKTVTNHNAAEDSHNDIRLLIAGLTARFNAFMDSDDDTLDQASEFVEYIKANRTLIESVTTTKVNVSDIIDNLTTSVSNKPLSAKQGVQLKALIDAIKVPTKLSELAEDATHRTVTDTEKTTWNNKSDFSGDYNDLSNKPTKVSDFENDANYVTETALTAKGYQTAAQVQAYAQPKGNYATPNDIKDLQQQIYNTLDDDDVSVEETETGSVVTIGSKTVTIKNGQDGTVQIEPLFAESVDWLNENGDTSKLYILPNNLIYAYMYSEGEAASYTNWLPLADTTTLLSGDTPGTVMTGYFSGNRLNSSGLLKTLTGYGTTGFIPYTYSGASDYICIKGSTCTPNNTYQQELCFYDTNHAFLGYGGFSCADYDDYINGDNGTVGVEITQNDTDYTITWTPSKMTQVKNGTIDTSKIAYFRFCTGDFANAIITVNEEISGGGGTAAGYQWASTGHSFIPTDYEDRIIVLEKKVSGGASSVQSYIAERNTYIAPVPSGYCESHNTYTDTGVTVLDVYSLETMQGMFSALASANTDYITETLLGKDASGTYDIYKYELDLKPAVDTGYTSVMNTDKPVFIITAGLHGIEHDAVHEVYHFMKDLCENWVESDHLEYLRTNVKFVIVPISNPWGYVNKTYNNSNDVDLNKNFGDNSGYQNNGTANTGANAYSEAETVLLKGVFDSYPKAIFHLECHGKAGHDTAYNHVIWFSLMKSLKSKLVEICSNTVIHQIGRRLYKMGFDTGKSEGGYITYYTLNGRPKDYTCTQHGILSCTMEGTGRMSVAGHTTYTKYEQQINAEALENFILRVLDAFNSRVEI